MFVYTNLIRPIWIRNCLFVSLTRKAFYSNGDDCEKALKASFRKILNKPNKILFAPQVLNKCTHNNFGTELNHDRSFSNEDIDTDLYIVDASGKSTHGPEGKHVGISFQSVFSEGLDVLCKFAEEDGRLPFRIQAYDFHGPVIALGRFLLKKDFHEKSLSSLLTNERMTKSNLSRILAVHLISQLVYPMQGSCMISNDYQYRDGCCACDNDDCQSSVLYGNTGIGSEYLWFGYPDIMVFPQGEGICSIAIPHKEDKLDLESLDEQDKYMLKNDFINLENLDEICAQTIVYSIYQKMFQQNMNRNMHGPDFPVVSLIPTISMCKDGFDIYMYDSIHDVLLKTYGDPIPLWEKDTSYPRLDLSSVFILWMVINHLTFRPKLTKNKVNFLAGSFGFHKLLTEKQWDKIESTVKMAKKVEVTEPKIIVKPLSELFYIEDEDRNDYGTPATRFC